MNADRRKRIEKLTVEVREKLAGLIDDIRNEAESIKDEEQEAFDNLPESLQSGEKGDAMQESISRLEDAVSSIESIYLDEIASALEDAAGN